MVGHVPKFLSQPPVFMSPNFGHVPRISEAWLRAGFIPKAQARDLSEMGVVGDQDRACFQAMGGDPPSGTASLCLGKLVTGTDFHVPLQAEQ